MKDQEAREFIASAVGERGGAWADIGAGTGTFTRALRSLLRPGSRIYAIDQDPAAIRSLRAIGDGVVAVQADFSQPLALPDDAPLDGILLANALHFLPDAGDVLTRFAGLLEPGGRVILVEYDGRAANPWVPFPLASSRWPRLAATAGLVNPSVTARRRSEYAGELYVAVADRAGSGPR